MNGDDDCPYCEILLTNIAALNHMIETYKKALESVVRERDALKEKQDEDLKAKLVEGK